MKRFDGTELSIQLVPQKFEPEALTAVPTTPDVGAKVKLGVRRLNTALPTSPLVPVTKTKYEPVAPEATVNEPDITPPATAHVGFAIRPLGPEDMVQLVSATEKPEPNTITTVPGAPEAGFRVIAGVTVKLAPTRSPVGYPVTFRDFKPRIAVDRTWNFPFRFPPVIAQS